MPTNPLERRVDTRKRISLAGVADHDRYRIDKMADETIVLTPVISVPVGKRAPKPTGQLPSRSRNNFMRTEVEPRLKKEAK